MIGAIVVGCDDSHKQGAPAAAGLQPRVQGLLDLVHRAIRVELDELDVLHEPFYSWNSEKRQARLGVVAVVAEAWTAGLLGRRSPFGPSRPSGTRPDMAAAFHRGSASLGSQFGALLDPRETGHLRGSVNRPRMSPYP